MKSFFDRGTVVGHDVLTVQRSPKVIELEFPGHEGSLYTYLLPQDEESAWVIACWGDALDFLNKMDKEMRDTEVEKKWPRMAALLERGREKDFESGALVRIKDPETDEMRWGVLTTVTGMDVRKNPENLWGFPQLLRAIEIVHKASAAMYHELKNNPPKNWPEAQKALLERCEGAEASLFFDFGFLQEY